MAKCMTPVYNFYYHMARQEVVFYWRNWTTTIDTDHAFGIYLLILSCIYSVERLEACSEPQSQLEDTEGTLYSPWLSSYLKLN